MRRVVDSGHIPVQRIPAPSFRAGVGSLLEDEEMKLLPASTAHVFQYVGYTESTGRPKGKT